MFLGSLLIVAQRDVDLVDLDLPLLVLPLPQQRGLQSEEVLLPHDAVVEEVQLELTAVGFSEALFALISSFTSFFFGFWISSAAAGTEISRHLVFLIFLGFLFRIDVTFLHFFSFVFCSVVTRIL